jgi:hypothetical protein
MKPKSIILLVFMLIIAGYFTSCKKQIEDPTDEPPIEKPVTGEPAIDDPIIEYPIEIPFIEYSLQGTSCRWKQGGSYVNDRLVIINSKEELEEYLICSDGNYPEIDFAKYTLLLTGGITASSPPKVMQKQLQQISINEYFLYVSINVGYAMKPDHWLISIKVPKLSQNDVVTLNVDLHY